MEFKKTNRHFDVEITMSDAEIQTIVGVIEDLQSYRNNSLDDIKGIRGEIYKKFLEILHA